MAGRTANKKTKAPGQMPTEAALGWLRGKEWLAGALLAWIGEREAELRDMLAEFDAGGQLADVPLNVDEIRRRLGRAGDELLGALTSATKAPRPYFLHVAESGG